MTTPTNENRDTDRIDVTYRTDRADRTDPAGRLDPAERFDTAAPETRHRLDLSITKIAAGACAAAIAAAVGSKLGVGGTIVGAAVASVVATSASAVIGHSLERGKTAARKAIPVALTPHDEARMKPSLADRALTDSDVDEIVAADARRTWKDRIPGRKPLIAAGLASFLIGTGAVTALEMARKGEFPGYHSNVFTNDPGQGGGSHDQPAPENPGGSGTRGATPSQGADSPSPTASGSGGSGGTSPSSIPSTPSDAGSGSGSGSGSASSGPSTPSTGPSGGSSGPTSPTGPTSGANPTPAPGTSGATAPSSSGNGLGKVTPSGGPTG